MRKSHLFRGFSAAALTTLTAGSLIACSTDSADNGENANASGNGDDATTQVVTSTSVWADVADEVLDDAEIEALITDPGQNPHHFEPAATDIATALEADLVVVGGGGYDAWLYEPIMEDAGEENIIHPLPLISHDHAHGHDHDHEHGEEGHEHDHEHGEEGHDHDHEHGHDHAHGDVHSVEGNEHIWFDVDAITQVAEDLAAKEEDADATAVVEQMDELRERLSNLPEATVAQTETIGDYLIDDSSLTDVTPTGYRQATLNHSEPAAADLAAFLEAIESGEVDILLYNPQTATDLTERIHGAAEENDVQIVTIGELPPEGTEFLDYFEEVVSELEDAAENVSSEQ
ncbi:hypothetical protein C3B44_09910 [Corynebacterium yudongzhengii]|uniref:ABC transporter substrate-binding protein n=1 Tax=Corynebacterium yudongzhengii TaxID=2080740 RepID=A0A2U1T5R9_9CORY|nr:zinc ABC transporter substrate-binding protein [Corynebacterium yudongzhengii]AWB82612.1 hypothetical protein C3B44_09910 [Corynebacterium yudongzhengii]PWC01346.1 hypothetical protein DF222_08060 [Corynebacterium yudongzhengii]